MVVFIKLNIIFFGVEKCFIGYELVKGVDFDVNEQEIILGSIKGSIIFCYVEVLLIYVEVRVELGNIIQNDLDIIINKLCDRVGMLYFIFFVGYIDLKGDFMVVRGYEGVLVFNLLQEI